MTKYEQYYEQIENVRSMRSKHYEEIKTKMMLTIHYTAATLVGMAGARAVMNKTVYM